MTEKLRFTGDWPPASLLGRFPNWEYALDEEDVEGQDETTIRPESQQKVVGEDTVFTAAKAKQANGMERIAIVAVVAGRIDSVDVFIDDRDAWRVNRDGSKWEPFIQTWLPESERMQHVLLSDTSIFPLTVATELPAEETGKPLTEEIR